MNIDAIKGLAELMGADKEQVERIESLVLSINGEGSQGNRTFELDFTNGDDIGNQTKLMDAMRKALWTFDNADEVEVDVNLINDDMLELIWKNINAYAYDVESFFLNRFIFYLKEGKKTVYKMYFSIEDGNIFLYVKHSGEHDFTCGTILIKDGKFVPCGAIHGDYVESLTKAHMKQNLPFDRKILGDRSIMNCLLYIIVINQMVNSNREVITETTRRIELPTKKKSKKKNYSKKTKQIRYIKVDTEKVKRIRDEYERVERGSYQRHLSEWSRRGYWMTTRNGEKKWIKPTTCHAKGKVGEKVQKLYKIN